MEVTLEIYTNSELAQVNALIAKIRTVIRQTEINSIIRELDAINDILTDGISDLIKIAIQRCIFPLPE